jgi:invasion protein IalB
MGAAGRRFLDQASMKMPNASTEKQMNHGIRSLSAIPDCVRRVAATVALVCASGGVMSAENDRRMLTANEVPISENFPAVEVAPRGQQQIRELRYSPWRKLCFKAARSPDTKIVCRTTISGAWDTGQVAIRFDLIEREGDAATRLQIFVPTGFYLRPGIKLTVDGRAPVQVPYVICLSNACVAGNVADPGFVRDLESGQRLVLQAVNPNILTVAASLPLGEFAKIHQGPPTQVLEQDLDEK